MKKIKVIAIIIIAICSLSASIKSVKYHNFPPTNCTGAPNGYTCGFCHSSHPDNQLGGGVSINGIPVNYTAGTVYPFSLQIHHFASDRKMFGYDIAAIDAEGNNVGTFTTTNLTATVNAGELTSHNPAVVADTSTKTIAGLFWTAPTTALTPSQLPISFYFCGNACDHNNQPTGDYVYNDSFHTNPAPLALNFVDFKIDKINSKTVFLQWQCANEKDVAKYTIEVSNNGLIYQPISDIIPQASSNNNHQYSYQYSNVNIFSSYSFRIKFLNKNGLFGYSDVQKLKSNINIATANIFPNPIQKSTVAKIHFQTSSNSNCSLIITNTAGAMIEQKMIQVQKGNNDINYPINPALKSGMYYVSIIQDNKMIYNLTVVVND